MIKINASSIKGPNRAKFRGTPAALGKGLISLALLSGCVPKPPVCVPPVAPAEVKITTEIKGDKNVGEVLFIKQLHSIPDTRLVRKEILENFSWLIGEYQVKIAKFLEDNKIKHVFDEGRTTDLTPDNRQESALFVSQARAARLLFPQGIKESSASQFAVFGLLIMPTGAEFYAVFHPDVTIHRTLSPENDALYSKLVAQHGDRKEFTFDLREKFAAAEVMSFLGEHPGERVALTFGAAHEFNNHFASYSLPPVFKTVIFPRVFYDGAKSMPERMCPVIEEAGIDRYWD